MLSLSPGDNIGIVSPSSPITVTCPKRYERAKYFLKSKGFGIVEGSQTGKIDSYRSGSIIERANEINTFFRDDSIKCIMSTIGGMNSNSLLPFLDYAAFERSPKIVIGYSDFTAVLFALYKKTGITTFYGPALVATLGELEPFNELSYGYMMDIISDNRNIPYEYRIPEYWSEERIDWESQERSKARTQNAWITVNSGRATGRLICGNLNTIQGFFGTEYMPDIQYGDILMIEDSMKDAAEIERSFSMLKCAGVFEKVAGIIYGKHELFNDRNTGRKPYEIMMEVLGQRNIPILAEFDCSHTHPMYTMPIGSIVQLDSSSKEVILINSSY